MDERDAGLEASLQQVVNGSRLGTPCYAYSQLSSTMDFAQALAEQGAAEGTCVWAERQTAGRGRAGRSWVSPAGGVYCSFILRPTKSLTDAPQLALVSGLAVAETLHHLSGLRPAIRWPNDVLLDGEKVAGILVESASQGAQVPAVIVGIGINVMTAPRDLPSGATSLSVNTPSASDRFLLTGRLCRQLSQRYDQWSREGFSSIREELMPWIGMFGKLVRIATGQAQNAATAFRRGPANGGKDGHPAVGGGSRQRREKQPAQARRPKGGPGKAVEIQGQAVDLDEQGRLLVRLETGIIRSFDAGEVTLLR